MIQDDFGIYRLKQNGTLFSFDRNDTVIDSKQLTGEEFKALTGCNMAAPGMPSSETEQCLQKKEKTTIPNSNVSAKHDRGGRFPVSVIECVLYACMENNWCSAVTDDTCQICVAAMPELRLPGFCF
jgi:hypothetical protein